jgi:uncharacterized protein (UPF0335 family)
MTNNDIKDLFDKYIRVENEIKLLQEDKKELLAEFKDRVEPKVFKAALSAARAKSKLKPHESNDFDAVMMLIESELSIEHID